MAQQQSYDLALEINTTEPIIGCTPLTLVFTLTNWDDAPIENVSLDLILVPNLTLVQSGGFIFSGNEANPDNPNPSAPLSHNRYTLSGLTVPGLDDPGTGVLKVKVGLRLDGPVADNDHEIHYRGCYENGALCDEIQHFTNLIPEQTFTSIGTSQTETSLTSVAIGYPAGLRPLPGNQGGQDVLINGILLIDANYTFIGGSNLYMGEGSGIRVMPGNSLTINATQVRGCSGGWQGIEVLENATLQVQGNLETGPTGVTIMDAVSAISLRNNATLKASKAFFINNHIGIEVPGGIFVNMEINENTFEADEFSLAPVYAGFRVVNHSTPITLNNNQYRNMQFGIYSSNSSLIVNHDKFKDIFDAGILAEGKGGHTLMQHGNGMDEANPSFENCLTGIRAVNMHVTIEQNAMKDVTWGISLRNGKLKNAFIRDNIIRAGRTGISINSWQPLSYNLGLVVEHNEISIDGNTGEGTGIRAELLYGTNTSACALLNNQISLGDARYGIWLNNTSKLGISVNDVMMENNHEYRGISLLDSYKNGLYCNYVKGSDTNAEQDGIYLETTSMNSLSCNTTHLTERGVYYLGENMPTAMQGHQFHGHNRALQYGNGGVAGAQTGIQSHRGNRWMQLYQAPDFGVWHRGSFEQLGNSKIIIDQSDEPVPGQVQLRTSEEPTQVNSIGSIFVSLSGNTYSCGSTNPGCPPIADGFADEGNEADKRIADGSYTAFGYYPEVQTWTARRQLYRRLLETPSLAVQGGPEASFFSTEANTTVGQFEQVRKQLEELYRPVTAVQTQLDANQEAIVTRMQQVRSIEEQLGTAPDAQEEASLKAQRLALQSEITAYEAAQATLYQSEKTERAATAVQVLALNNNISVAKEYEQFQSKVNQVVLQSIIDDQDGFDEAETALLSSIANTCPFSGGEAVYQARALLGEKIFYDDDVLCQPASPLIKQKEDLPFDFTLYPNPSNGFVVLELEAAAVEEGTIILTDALGKQVFISQIRAGEEAISLIINDLLPGIYFVNVRTTHQSATKILSNLR